MLRIIAIISVLFTLAACHGAHNHHRGGSVRVDGVGEVDWGGDHPGRKCPPGHAKKGWC